ncbi:MAG: efflux RND transporter permease subunit [bacterium]
MLNKLSKASVNHPWPVIIVFLLITVFFAVQLPGLKIDTDMKSQIPDTMPSSVKLNKIEEIFGGTEIILVNITTDNIMKESTLARVKELSDQFEKIEGVEKVNSLFTVPDIRGEDNSLIIENMITKIPENQSEMEVLRNRIIESDSVYGSIVAEDFSSAAIVLVIEEGSKDDLLFNNINSVINSVPGEEKIFTSGLPVARSLIDKYIRKDMQRLLPSGILLMLVFLFFCFKQLRGMLLPFLIVIMSIIVAFGFIPLLGWKVQMVTIILPVILLAVANDYGIHIIARYQEENTADNEKTERELSDTVVSSLSKPIIAAGLTTILGLLCLRAHILIPAKQLGVLAAIGIGFALLGSIMFIPAVLVILPKAKPVRQKKSILENILRITADLVVRYPKAIIISFLLLIIFTALGISNLLVDTNQISYFQKNEKIVIADELARKHFGGSSSISLIAEGDILDPEVMGKIDTVVSNLKKDNQISTVTSISTQLSQMNQVLHNDIPEYNKVPDTRAAIEQYLMLYSMSADTSKLIDFNYEHALINARIKTNSTAEIGQLIHRINERLDEMENPPISIVGGVADMVFELADLVVKGQINSLLISILVVSFIMMILFRSFTAGLLSTIPLGLSTISLFGLMGFLNIELNIVTALLSSIMIGVGIDYTIHFLWRFREEKKSSETNQAVINTLMTTGRGIVFNALSVIIGFVVLLLSNFLPVNFFGFLVFISISTCLIGALVVLPAICIVTGPSFLEAAKSPGS